MAVSSGAMSVAAALGVWSQLGAGGGTDQHGLSATDPSAVLDQSPTAAPHYQLDYLNESPQHISDGGQNGRNSKGKLWPINDCSPVTAYLGIV